MNAIPPVKTFEEHRQFRQDLVKLQLWFAWHWRRQHAGEPFQAILRQRIDLYRGLGLNQGGSPRPDEIAFVDPLWSSLEAQLCALVAACQDDSTADRFESKAFQAVQPTLDAHVRQDYEQRPYVLDFQCGSLAYERPYPDHPGRVYVHIANALTPRSIFDDSAHLPACLLDLMQKSSVEYGVDSLGTGSWLNSYPPWLKLFPAEWVEHMTQEDKEVSWHLDFWGQFINARGTFHARRGRRLRETGEFPFYPRYSWCSFEALRAHLT